MEKTKTKYALVASERLNLELEKSTNDFHVGTNLRLSKK